MGGRNNRVIKGDYRHYSPTDTEGIEIDFSLSPPRPSTTSLPQNGFIDRADSVVTFDELTRTVSIAPTGDSFAFWSGGKSFVKTQEETLVIPDVEGLHYTIYNQQGELECTDTFDFETIIVDNAFVSALYWSVTDQEAVIVADERHLRMDAETHGYLHQVFGTQWINGLSLGNILTNQNGDDDEDAQCSVLDGAIRDEDIEHLIINGSPQTLAAIAEIPMLYRDGAAGNWRKIAATQFPVTTTGTGRAAWNEFTGGAWQLTEITNNDFVLTHLFATGDTRHPIVGIVGQGDYVTRNLAEAGAEVELINLIFGPLDLLTPEFKAIATIIFQTGNGKANQVKSSIEETDSNDDYIDWRRNEIGSGAASSGTTNHPDLTNRDLADQHPIIAITGLQTALDSKVETVTGTVGEIDVDNTDPKNLIIGTADEVILESDISVTEVANKIVQRDSNGEIEVETVVLNRAQEPLSPLVSGSALYRPESGVDEGKILAVPRSRWKNLMDMGVFGGDINKVACIGLWAVSSSSSFSINNYTNISSITRRGLGQYRINFINTLANNTYATICTPATNNRYCRVYTRNASYFEVEIRTISGTAQIDNGTFYFAVIHNAAGLELA